MNEPVCGIVITSAALLTDLLGQRNVDKVSERKRKGVRSHVCLPFFLVNSVQLNHPASQQNPLTFSQVCLAHTQAQNVIDALRGRLLFFSLRRSSFYAAVVWQAKYNILWQKLVVVSLEEYLHFIFFSPCIKYLELVNEEGPLNCQCHSLRALFSLREILT